MMHGQKNIKLYPETSYRSYII